MLSSESTSVLHGSQAPCQPLLAPKPSSACALSSPLREKSARLLIAPKCRPRRSTGPLVVHAAAGLGEKIVVVGGGVGGLAVATRLARKGFDVTVLEKNAELGGRMQSVNVNSDFRFDTGPSLLLMPQKYYEGFEALGEDLDDHVALKRVMPAAYRVFFGDSSHLDLTADVGRMCQQLEEVEAGAGSQYLDFLAAAKATFDVSLPGFISRNFNSVMDYLNPAYLAPLLRRVDPLKLLGQHNRVLAGYFKDPRLRALFSFQDLYVGLSPYEAPGVFSLLAGTELVDGVWYPMGGFGKIRDALRGIAEKNGVKLQLNAEVASIEVDAGDRRVTGVRLKDGAAFPASAVVGNADLPYIYKHLINDAGAKSEGERLHRLQYSAGVIAFNWCLDTRPDRLLHHSVFLSDEYEASWRRASTAQQLPRRPNFYVHAPARTDPSVAPEGKDAITVLLPVANLQQQQEQQKQQGGTLPPESELVAAAREAVLRRFEECGVGDLRKHIIDEFVYSPTVWQSRYNVAQGAAFGLSHGFFQLAHFRPNNVDPSIQGLFFVGASTRPGNGVPLVLVGAGLCEERVLDYFNSR